MPIYEYKCQDTECLHEWEDIQNMSDESTKICPLCKKETAMRLISSTSFILNGGGWASSGYSNK